MAWQRTKHGPKYNPHVYAHAKVRGATSIEAIKAAGYETESTNPEAAKRAATRLESHPETQAAIEQAKADWLRATARKRVADLWPSAVYVLQSLLLDPALSDGNKIKAVELAAKLTGNLNESSGGTVQVLTINEGARTELRKLQADPDAQRTALDALEELTQRHVLTAPREDPVDVQVGIENMHVSNVTPVPRSSPDDKLEAIEDSDLRALARAAEAERRGR